ncbi:MAG: DUF11 domain-containing protein, partial [Flavobacteriales bacterium]
LDDRLTGEDAGSWAITTDPSGSLTIGAGNAVDFLGLPDGDYVFTFTTAGALESCNESSVVTISVNDCGTDRIDLEIGKTIDSPNAVPGDEVVFTVSIRNLSINGFTGILVGDLLETGFAFVSSNPSSGTFNEVTGEWAIPVLEPLQQATLDITATVIEGGVYTNTAELLDSFPDDNNPDNDKATVTLSIDLPEGIDLVLEKSALPERALVDDEVVFTIKVTNKSATGTVSQIEISDLLNEVDRFIYLSHNEATGTTYDPTTGVWSIPQLLVGQEAILTITVQVPNEGTFANTASLLRSSPTDGNPSNNEATAVVRVNLPTHAADGFVFNQFSPNDDGINDFLKIKGIGTFQNNSIQIFNRYGQLVFEARNMTDDRVWDGLWKNEEAPEGTYFYVLDLGNSIDAQKGWIQLLR